MYTYIMQRKVMKAQIGIGFLWSIFAFFLITVICAYLVFTILPLLPVSHNVAAAQALVGLNTYIKYTFSFIDNSFYVIIVIVLFIGLFDGWENPSRKKAVIDLIGIFFLAYMNLAVTTILPSISIFNPAVNLQLTYTFFNSSYKVFILYFVMIISVILNLQHK